MEKRKIFITEHDMERLRKLLPETRPGTPAMPAHLQDLAGELDRAEVLASTAVPPHVITMNSRVRLRDLDTGEEETYTLVFPENADIERARISVLAPVGTGMLGYGVGDVIEWPVPAGIRRLRVEEVLYQPEAAGDYEL